jgi:hypothetical protein
MGSGAQRCVAQHGRDGTRCIARPCSPTLPCVARRCVARGVQHCAAMVDEELRASVCGATENYRLWAVRWPLRIAALTGACGLDGRRFAVDGRTTRHGYAVSQRKKAHRGAVRLGQDDRRTCAAHASGRREARLQVHPDDGRLQSDPPTKTHRSPSMSGNRTSETLGTHQ